MDKLIRVPKSNKAEEPLLDIEERRHNYDDRRSYTSYAEITKDFEDDFRCQDDEDEDDQPATSCSNATNIGNKIKNNLHTVNSSSCSSSSMITTEDGNRQVSGGSVKQLLIGNNNGNVGVGGRQRKQPILLPQHANASGGGDECSRMGRDTRSAAPGTTVSQTLAVGARRVGETDAEGTTEGAMRTDNHLRVKSSRTLQESIRESLTINNNPADTFNGQGNAATGTTTSSSSSSKALLD